MSKPGFSSIACKHGRAPSVASAPLVLLAVVLLATAGGVTASVARPTSRPAAVACLVLPAHRVLDPGARGGDALPGQVVAGRSTTVDEIRSEIVRISDEHLDLPPPCG